MKTTAELQHLANRNGWTIGPLTFAKIQRMSSDEALFNERLNTAEFNRALNEPKTKRENRANVEASKTQRMWADQATPEETEATIREVQTFCTAFPQFRGDYVPNREALVEWLRVRKMPITARNLVEAFQALGAEGKLILNPAAIGIGSDSEVTGRKLASHPQLWKILEPAKTIENQEKEVFDKMSAAEFKKTILTPIAEKELGVEIPGAAFRAFDRAWNSFTSLNPQYVRSDANREKFVAYLEEKNLDPTFNNLQAAYSALVDAGELELSESVAVSTTGKVAAGSGNASLTSGFVPNASSLGRKISSMTADEYGKWILNPTNRKAADAVLTGAR